MDLLRKYTNIPVPTVYHHDASPYNRLGGEYILMSKVMISSALSVALCNLKASLILYRRMGFLFLGFTIQCHTIIS